MRRRVLAFAEPHAHRFAELWRYYKVGLLNTAFGYGLYSLLVFLGLNLYVAQVLSHVTGAAFNYFMFRALVFKGARANLFSYVASYAVNYLLGLGLLAAIHQWISSPYLAGFITLVIVSGLNYLLLKLFVFPDGGRP